MHAQWLGENCLQGLVVTLDLDIACVDVLVKFLSSKYYCEKFLIYLSVICVQLLLAEALHLNQYRTHRTGGPLEGQHPSSVELGERSTGTAGSQRPFRAQAAISSQHL